MPSFESIFEVFNMNPLCREIFEDRAIVADFQYLCQKLSYVITEEGSKTIVFTYCDALFDCFEYIRLNASSVNIPDMTVKVKSTSKKNAGQKTDAYILSLTGKVLKPCLKGLRMIDRI